MFGATYCRLELRAKSAFAACCFLLDNMAVADPMQPSSTLAAILALITCQRLMVSNAYLVSPIESNTLKSSIMYLIAVLSDLSDQLGTLSFVSFISHINSMCFVLLVFFCCSFSFNFPGTLA